jgi:hypothetical protein
MSSLDTRIKVISSLQNSIGNISEEEFGAIKLGVRCYDKKSAETFVDFYKKVASLAKGVAEFYSQHEQDDDMYDTDSDLFKELLKKIVSASRSISSSEVKKVADCEVIKEKSLKELGFSRASMKTVANAYVTNVLKNEEMMDTCCNALDAVNGDDGYYEKGTEMFHKSVNLCGFYRGQDVVDKMLFTLAKICKK